MFIVESYGLAIFLCFITMLCWGSWANTQKLSKDSWSFPLFYWFGDNLIIAPCFYIWSLTFLIYVIKLIINLLIKLHINKQDSNIMFCVHFRTNWLAYAATFWPVNPSWMDTARLWWWPRTLWNQDTEK